MKGGVFVYLRSMQQAYLDGLNERQKEAVLHLNGPLMIIAGAGSGKTKVLTSRIAHLMYSGVDSFNILALTFTNKAAAEMKARVEKALGNTEARNLYIGTCDIYNYRYNFIFKIDNKTGIITKLAGNTGSYVYTGSGTNALQTGFQITGLKVDKLGDIYIADPINNCILKYIKSSGTINNFAGQATLPGDYKGDGGLAINAYLNTPVNIDFDSSGNVLLVDEGNNVIRNINKNTGIITTIAGVGNLSRQFLSNDTVGAKCAPLHLNNGAEYYSGIAPCNSGGIYFVDIGNGVIKKYDTISFIPKTPTLKISAPKLNICEGENIRIKASISDSASIPIDMQTCQWYKNGIAVGADSMVYITDHISNNDSLYCEMLVLNTVCSTILLKSNVIKLSVIPKPILNFPIDSVLCNQQIINLDATQQDQSITYLWQDGITIPKRDINQPGKYFLSIQKGVCAFLDSINIIYKQTPPNKNIDTSLCGLSSIMLNVNYPYSTYLWQDNSTSNNIIVNKTGVYYCSVKNYCGTGIDTFNIYDYCEILIPNVFSPNSDGINDTWSIKLLSNYQGVSVDVFNRYGQPVFHSLGYNIEWNGKYDGKDLPIATYYYVIKLSTPNKSFQGSVTILR